MANRRLTPDELRSALAFATNVSEKRLLPQKEEAVDASESLKTEPGDELAQGVVQPPAEGVAPQGEPVETEVEEDNSLEDFSENINERLDELEKKIEEGNKEGIKEITKAIKDALAE